MVVGDIHFTHFLPLQKAVHLSEAKEDGSQHPVHGTGSWTVAGPTSIPPPSPTPGEAKRTGSVIYVIVYQSMALCHSFYHTVNFVTYSHTFVPRRFPSHPKTASLA